MATKKSAVKKSAKTSAKKSATKKSAKKAPAKKTAAKKTTAKKAVKKAPAKKAAKKSATKKSAAKSAKSSSKKAKPGNRYAPAASKSVEREMKSMHQGKLKSGRSGKKVTNPKQAIAIGLSEARKEGADVPPNPNENK